MATRARSSPPCSNECRDDAFAPPVLRPASRRHTGRLAVVKLNPAHVPTEDSLPEFEDVTEIEPEDLERLEMVGNGCTAVVYRGHYKTQGITVAIKVIDWQKTGMGEKEQRAFDRELKIMPKVDHANLVKFIGVASMERPFQIVSEFCHGGCCFEFLHNSDVDLVWEQQCKMALDVARAMEYLHGFKPQIIHRDLKSPNLLLSKPVKSVRDRPHVKVSDFGHSRMMEKAPGAGGWGMMTKDAGTTHWMAPEVFQGNIYDQKVDIYSYAMILFEIICREIPFEDEDPKRIGRLVVSGRRPDVEAIPPACPKKLSSLLPTCWNAMPAERPDFTSIVNALQSIRLKNSSAWSAETA